MQSKYYDSSSAIQVIGCVFSDTSLLDDTGEYVFSEDDFCIDPQKVVEKILLYTGYGCQLTATNYCRPFSINSTRIPFEIIKKAIFVES